MAINQDLKILIVGHNNFYRKNVDGMLHKIGLRKIEQTGDGPTAWDLMKKSKPGIVIAQWEMPEMNGMALLRLIRSDVDQCDTPVMLWTEGITRSDVVKAGEAGVNAILVDPFSVEILENKIQLILEFDMTPSTEKAKCFLEKGDALLNEGKLDQALKEFEKVLEILESAEVYYNIGYIKTALGEYDEALAAFRKATQINQMYAKAYQAMAGVHLRMGNQGLVAKYLNVAGEFFREREKHDKAESIFHEILAINPNTINVYNSLGIIYRRQNRLEDAVKLYQKAIKISPEDENIHFNMGRAYLDMGNPQIAKRCFAQALKINPDFDTAQGMLRAIESMETPT